MDDESILNNNLANDEWDAAIGTHDELKLGDNRDIGHGITEKPGIDKDDYNSDTDFKSILIDNGDDNLASNKPVEMNANNHNSHLFATDNLLDKMGENMAASEAMINDKPLRTEKTDELEKKEREDAKLETEGRGEG